MINGEFCSPRFVKVINRLGSSRTHWCPQVQLKLRSLVHTWVWHGPEWSGRPKSIHWKPVCALGPGPMSKLPGPPKLTRSKFWINLGWSQVQLTLEICPHFSKIWSIGMMLVRDKGNSQIIYGWKSCCTHSSGPYTFFSLDRSYTHRNSASINCIIFSYLFSYNHMILTSGPYSLSRL